MGIWSATAALASASPPPLEPALLANELLTKSLAKSAWFQRFAAKTHTHVDRISKEGAKRAQELKSSEATQQLGQKVASQTEFVKRFGKSFMDNIKQEYTKLEQQGRAG